METIPPRIPLTDSQIAAMPLHALTERAGTEGLMRRFSLEITSFTIEEQQMANQALIVAETLHRDDDRSTEPYVNHLLRVSTRLMTRYNVRDIDVICAGLLHDSIEDHAPELCPDVAPEDQRNAALNTLGEWFNPRVAGLVKAVTNPVFSIFRDKHEQYVEHVIELTNMDDPWPTVIKMSDFTDNATGLIYSVGDIVPRLANKYLPLVAVFERALMRPDIPLSHEVISYMRAQLELTAERLIMLAA